MLFQETVKLLLTLLQHGDDCTFHQLTAMSNFHFQFLLCPGFLNGSWVLFKRSHINITLRWTTAFKNYRAFSTNLNWYQLYLAKGWGVGMVKPEKNLQWEGLRWLLKQHIILLIKWKKKYCQKIFTRYSFKSLPLPLIVILASLIIPQSWENSKNPIWNYILHSHKS